MQIEGINIEKPNDSLLEELKKIVKGFSTPPFLFIGAGFSKRYLNTPSWKDLLAHFAAIVRDDDKEISFNYYSEQARVKYGKKELPYIASCIRDDFNMKWLGNKDFRKDNPIEDNNSDVFHSAISNYIKSFEWNGLCLKNEIDDFKSLCSKHIAGIITTNYDTFLEELSGYRSFIGQSELLLSNPMEIAEIYKIHGCVTKPDSIILTQEDYEEYYDKSQYLSAKLITIFMEHPIVFLGYSLQDPDILKLIKTIAQCFDSENSEKIKNLQERMFFVEYNPNKKTEIIDHSISYNAQSLLTIKKITVSDFGVIFRALHSHQQKINVKTMRFLKESFVEYALSNKPNTVIKAYDVENKSLDGDELAIYFGIKGRDPRERGLIAKNPNDLFRDILFDDFGYGPDEILDIFLPEIIAGGSGGFPVFKYIAKSKNDFVCLDTRIHIASSYNDLLNKTLIESQKKQKEQRDILTIWNEEEHKKAIRQILILPESKMNAKDLRYILMKIMIEKPNVLERDSKTGYNPTDIRKLIKILDYLENKERAMTKLRYISQKPLHDSVISD